MAHSADKARLQVDDAMARVRVRVQVEGIAVWAAAVAMAVVKMVRHMVTQSQVARERYKCRQDAHVVPEQLIRPCHVIRADQGADKLADLAKRSHRSALPVQHLRNTI